jgi:DNA-binding transcriptional ArsR family regulator
MRTHTECKAREATRESARAKQERGLAEALWPAARRQVLGLLLSRPDREWHLREIARQTQLSPSAVQREVLLLAEAGIVERRVESRRAYYRANARCPIFPELRGIVLKTVGLADGLREALAGVENIRIAFIFGSMAKGTFDSRSDVDVMIVGDASFADISGALRAAEDRLGREVTPTVYSPQEFEEERRAKHHFLMRVLEEPKVMLVGNEDDLG